MRSVYISDKKKKGCVFVWVISCNTISRNFPIRKGLEIPSNLSQNIIPFAAFSIIPFLEEEASYPVEKAGFARETNPLTNLLIHPPIFRFRFLDTRAFLFLFFIYGRISKLPLCFPSSIESFASKTIHESLVSLPFPRLQLDDVQQEVTNLLLDIKGREICSSPSSVITIQSKNKILVALSSSFTPLSCVMIHSRVMIINFFLLLKVATQFTA